MNFEQTQIQTLIKLQAESVELMRELVSIMTEIRDRGRPEKPSAQAPVRRR